MGKSVSDMRLFLAKTIAASQNEETPVIDLQQFSLDGYFGAQIALTGDGTARVEVGVSIDGTNYIYSDDSADYLFNSFVKTSGPGSDGKDVVTFSPVCARWMKFKVTETGGASSIVVTLDVAMQ